MIYADANVVIRLVEGDVKTRAPIEALLQPFRNAGRFLLTSSLTRLECRVKPVRVADHVLLALYDRFFTSTEVEIVDVSRAVIEKATELRALLHVKTPDAIHLATAVVHGAASFLTGDQSLARCKEIRVVIA